MAPSKILLVDDSATELKVMSEALAEGGYEVVTATDGESALELARSEEPGVILLDVLLPGQNGFQVCRALKRDPTTRSIPVILVTSKDQESDRFWGKKQGADEYLVKPVEGEELVRQVARFT